MRKTSVTETFACPVPAALDIARGVFVAVIVILLAWLFIEFILWAAGWDEEEKK